MLSRHTTLALVALSSLGLASCQTAAEFVAEHDARHAARVVPDELRVGVILYDFDDTPTPDPGTSSPTVGNGGPNAGGETIACELGDAIGGGASNSSLPDLPGWTSNGRRSIRRLPMEVVHDLVFAGTGTTGNDTSTKHFFKTESDDRIEVKGAVFDWVTLPRSEFVLRQLEPSKTYCQGDILPAPLPPGRYCRDSIQPSTAPSDYLYGPIPGEDCPYDYTLGPTNPAGLWCRDEFVVTTELASLINQTAEQAEGLDHDGNAVSGFNIDEYDVLVYGVPHRIQGSAPDGFDFVFMEMADRAYSAYTTIHELGHWQGLIHASRWSCGPDRSPFGYAFSRIGCENISDYGDGVSFMGGVMQGFYLTAHEQVSLGLLDAASVGSVPYGATGHYSINDLDGPVAANRALKIDLGINHPGMTDPTYLFLETLDGSSGFPATTAGQYHGGVAGRILRDIGAPSKPYLLDLSEDPAALTLTHSDAPFHARDLGLTVSVAGSTGSHTFVDVCWQGSGPDADADGVPDLCDQCDQIPNDTSWSMQDDDLDGLTNGCDDDPDGDGVVEGDNCWRDANELQEDDDGDGVGNVCDCAPYDHSRKYARDCMVDPDLLERLDAVSRWLETEGFVPWVGPWRQLTLDDLDGPYDPVSTDRPDFVKYMREELPELIDAGTLAALIASEGGDLQETVKMIDEYAASRATEQRMLDGEFGDF